MNDPDEDVREFFRPAPGTDLRCKVVDEEGNEVRINVESHLIVLNATPHIMQTNDFNHVECGRCGAQMDNEQEWKRPCAP
jgi:hypothetical protein